eukprot:TRINITY_DN75318_c0_g1_i1.p1 TRINITY_DN75318_c0_g1~~TRINITY_DN75318_c0_g1_i1.p1  ORF type:complete len:524 (-),score=59.77 TRINITY_DN75318_c0_g1_i1:129-1700(-)
MTLRATASSRDGQQLRRISSWPAQSDSPRSDPSELPGIPEEPHRISSMTSFTSNTRRSAQVVAFEPQAQQTRQVAMRRAAELAKADATGDYAHNEVGPGPGKVEVNRPGIVPFIFSTLFWVVAATGTLLSTMWIYYFVEVRGYEAIAAESAAFHARLHASEVLLAAPAAALAVEMAFRTRAIKSLSDYNGLLALLRPHFEASDALNEIRLADQSGTVLLTQTRNGSRSFVEILSDRSDCVLVEGQRGCLVEPLRSNSSTWYLRAVSGQRETWWPLPVPLFWDGPSFARENPHEVTCDELCWQPTVALVAKVGGGYAVGQSTGSGNNDSSKTNAWETQAVPTIIVRAAMNARGLQAAAARAAILSRGEAFFCTADGVLFAGADMADVVYINQESGVLRMRHINELSRAWASVADESFVREADGNGTVVDAVRVSPLRLEAPSNSTRELGNAFRIVLAVPQEAFMDKILAQIMLPGFVVGALPIVVTFLASLVVVYMRFRARGHSHQAHDEVDPVLLEGSSKQRA